MTNKQDSVRIALGAILLLIYTWNSCPFPGTDISRSMVTIGGKFAFPINFLTQKHAKLTSAPGTVESNSCKLAEQLNACCKVAMLLVRKHRAWHRELVNSCRQDPRVYSRGDIVFA
jgi:hypothetical protein